MIKQAAKKGRDFKVHKNIYNEQLKIVDNFNKMWHLIADVTSKQQIQDHHSCDAFYNLVKQLTKKLNLPKPSYERFLESVIITGHEVNKDLKLN